MKQVLCTISLFMCLLLAGNSYALTLFLGGNIARHELVASTSPSTNFDTDVAHFTSNFYVSPSVSIHSTPNYFASSRLGWLIEFNFGFLNIEQKSSSPRFANQDMRVTGAFGHLTPLLFYRFGDKELRGERGWALTIGGGFGVSFIALDGKYVTDLLPEDEREVVVIDDENGYFPLPATLIDFTWGNWYSKLSYCFGGTGFEVGEYSYVVLFRSLGVGYTLEI